MAGHGQKFDVPLQQATTPSLEALKSLSLGRKAANEKGDEAALPYHRRAIELDPNFAMAYNALAPIIQIWGDWSGLTVYSKAFELWTAPASGKSGHHRRLLFECTRRTE